MYFVEVEMVESLMSKKKEKVFKFRFGKLGSLKNFIRNYFHSLKT